MKRRSHSRTLVAVVLAATSGVGCDGRAGEAELASRAEFVDTYVDLRVTALRTDSGALTDSARAVVLERHGATEQALLDFAAAHGADLDFMRDLWNEIETRLDSVRAVPGEGP